MSRLAMQISVAAVFLSTVVSATNKSNSTMNDPISAIMSNRGLADCYNKCDKKSQDCIPIRILSYSLKRPGICFDRIKPTGKKTIDGKPVHGSGEIMSQAYLQICSGQKETLPCRNCCDSAVLAFGLFRVDGEVRGGSCLCMAIQR